MEKKLRLYDRFWEWVIPMDREDVELHNAELAAMRQYERMMRAEAERLELENREAETRIALIEEENQRQRNQAKPYTAVARAEYALEMSLGKKAEGERTSAKVIVLLEEKYEGGPRQTSMSLIKAKTGSIIGEYHKQSVEEFIKARASWQLYVQPWLDGKLDTDDLKNMATLVDDCCSSIRFTGA